MIIDFFGVTLIKFLNNCIFFAFNMQALKL